CSPTSGFTCGYPESRASHLSSWWIGETTQGVIQVLSRSFRMMCNSETDALQRLMMLSRTTTAFSDWVWMTSRPMILKCCLGCLLRVSRKGVIVVRKVKIAEPCVMTIGHSNRSWKDFLDLLRAHRVKRVIDIRSVPRSRHNPQF